jgi:hypothetical protein
MKETNEMQAKPWNRPLKGWRWLAAWGLLIASLAAVTRLLLPLITDNSYGVSAASPWLLAAGIALAVVILIWFLVHCFSSRRNFKRLLLGLACLAGLIGLLYAEEDLRGWLAWGRFKAQWEAKGEKFNFAAVIPPEVSADRNFAMTPVAARMYDYVLNRNGHQISPPNIDVANRFEMPVEVGNGGPTNGIGNWQKVQTSHLEAWQRYYRSLSLTTNLFPVAPQPQTPAADVLLALSKYDSTIEELRQAAARPASRFPLNYDNEETFAILLPHLAPLKGCAVVLRLKALAELEAGQSETAVADVSLALQLADKIRPEPFLISQLVRIAMLHITEQAVWEGLAKHRWNDAQLVKLEQQLAGFDFVADYQAALRGENASLVSGIDSLRHHPGRLDSIGDLGQNESTPLSALPAYLIPSGWFYQNQLRCSKFILEQFLPVADPRQETISPRLVKQAEESFGAMPHTPYTVLCRMLLPGRAASTQQFAFAQAAVSLSRTACALERYRLAEAKYPETLDVLAPRFLAKIPRDPIGGGPLHYRLTEEGTFILYSVGWNQEDDGGTVGLTNSGGVDSSNGDWVWRYPDLPKT